MSLKYASTPQLHYGRQGSDNWRSRFPADARRISEAPPNQVVWAIEPNGQGSLAHYRGGSWRKLAQVKDWKTGAATLREDGSSMNNPVMFTLRRG